MPFHTWRRGKRDPLTKKLAFRVDELAQQLGGELIGDSHIVIRGFASLKDAGPDDLSFYSGTAFTGTTYAEELARTRAGALIIGKHHADLDVPQIIVSDPQLAANELVGQFFPLTAPEKGTHSLASVADSAKIGDDVSIMPFAYVGDNTHIGSHSTIHPGATIEANVRMGENCLIWPNAVIREGSIIGSNVIIHPGAVIGADGFGYARRDGKFIKLHHVGIVVVEDDVEIGANTTIDRGTLGRTLIRRGVKLDNLVHIAHNVEVGEDTVMAAQCGVSGSTVIGKRVLMGGQTGLVDHLKIGDEAVFIAQSGVIGDIPSRSMVSGYPARPHREVLRAQAELRNLSQLKKKIRELENKVARLLDND